MVAQSRGRPSKSLVTLGPENSGKYCGVLPFGTTNSEELFIPTAILSQTERQPYILFPRLWSEFDVPAIKIIRNVTEFNNALKAHLLNILPSVDNCTRLFCPSCSNIEAVL